MLHLLEKYIFFCFRGYNTVGSVPQMKKSLNQCLTESALVGFCYVMPSVLQLHLSSVAERHFEKIAK